MRHVVGAVALSPFVTLLVAMARGRVRARPCCTVDAERDLRLRAGLRS